MILFVFFFFFQAEDGIRDGHVTGVQTCALPICTINLPGNRVTVGRNGQVQANVNAREVVVLGKVKGNLTASDRVDIRNEGSLTGDVVCQRISIEDGAYFKGGIDIRKPNQKEMNGPTPANGAAKTEGTPAMAAANA